MFNDADAPQPVSLLWLANELYWRQNLSVPARSEALAGASQRRAKAGEMPNALSSRPAR